MNDLFAFLIVAVDSLSASLLYVVVIALMAAFVATTIFIAMLSDAVIYVGLALGPLLLVLTPLKIFRPLGPQWLKFMLTAVFYKLVAACLIFLAIETSKVVPSAGGTHTQVMIVYAFYLMLMIPILRNAPPMAAALVGGFAMVPGMPRLRIGGTSKPPIDPDPPIKIKTH